MATKRGASSNGVGPTAEGKKLVSRDFVDAIGDLGAARVVSRQLLTKSIGAFDPEVITYPRMYQMRKDAMIQMGLTYRKAPHFRAKWHIECEDPKIAAGVEEIIRNQWGAYTRMRLNKLDFGFQAGVKQYQYGQLSGTYEDPETGEAKPVWDSKFVEPVILGSPIPLIPEWVTPKLEKGHFLGINTNLLTQDGSFDQPSVPVEWAMWVVNEYEETFRNWYGYPLTGYAYRYWWSSWFRHHMEDRHFEMDADPPLMVTYPIGKYTDRDGNVTSNQMAALKMGDDLRGGATVAVPSDVFVDEQGKAVASPLWDAKFLTGGENLAAFRESADYLDVMKLRATLVPEQALVEGKGGTSSRNAAATYGDIFTESLAAEAADDDDDWNRYHIPQIVEVNWGKDAPRARKVTTGFEEEDLALVKGLIETAFTVDPNALPINFDELLKKAKLPVYSAKEQEERQEQVEEEQAEKQREAEANQPQEVEQVADEGNQQAQEQLKASQRREVIYLASKAKGDDHGPEIDAKPTKIARDAARRRTRAVAEMQRRMQLASNKRYGAALAAATAVVASIDSKDFVPSPDVEDEDLALKWPVLYMAIRRAMRFSSTTYDRAIQAELASMYHAAGASELQHLGLPLDAWDIEREDVQNWAQNEAGRLITTIDETLVDEHVRPWLSKKLGEYEQEGVIGQDFANIDTEKLALEMSQKFEGYPEWMSERVARTEARMGYNRSALDMFERIGVDEVQAYDGLGGKSGKTDEVCLRRNGEIMTLAEARKADEEEHPNGTFGVVPYVTKERLAKLRLEPGVLAMDAVVAEVPYAMTSEGLILAAARG